MGTDNQARIAIALDKLEIHEVLMRYCRGVDRRDRALIMSAFHPDAIDDHGRNKGGREQLADRVAGTASGQMMHFMGNWLIEIDGDTAFVESYFVGIQTFDQDGDPHTRLRGGRYLDRFERRTGEWRIAHRIVVDDWNRVDEVRGTIPDPGTRRSVRGPDDPLFDRDLLRQP